MDGTCLSLLDEAIAGGRSVRLPTHPSGHRRWSVAAAVGAAGLLCAASCATMPPVPVVPAWNQLVGAPIPIEDDERELWNEAKERRAYLEKDGQIVTVPELTVYLNGILARLLLDPLPEEAPRPQVWVVRSTDRDAATMADGTILVSTSLLAALENEAQLAALLGHELGHFTARHNLLQKRFDAVSRSTVVRMQLSRDNEAYCDRFSLDVVQRAGYDPRQTVRVMELMKAEEAGRKSGPEQFRSHPFIQERLRDLQRAIRVAPGETPSGAVRAAEYAHAIVTVLPVAAEIELRARLTDRAASTIARLLALQPDSGRAYYLKAELIRLTASEGRLAADARRAYERAVELAPDDPDAVRALGFLYYESGEVTRAWPLLRAYLRLSPEAADRKLVERYLAGEGDRTSNRAQ